ncbi:histidine kinase [Paenibacillus sp. 1011MAR3C5]|uniref:phage tail tube protein n=1 Tax=Paenibacillus sp. 1011MAR3C5 TaxID=1675787 RepID=UPI000E6D0778|nr:phage tail tube protein [Paenibacillus sp. 1011MAR3C5]RJE88625.1 histidine kinase [Paenibacillus sp. 1011MAR3C5]
MTKAAHRAIGTKLQMGLNFISDLSSISSPSVTREEIDVTTLDSEDEYREFIGGFKDAGEVSVSGFFVPTNVGQAAMYAALETGDVQQFQIIYPARLGASWSFEGIITNYNVTAELEGALEFEATIRVSGKPSLNMTPSTGLTALSLSGAGGALAPAFAADKNFYTFAGVTAATITATATAASHALKLFVDGVFVQALTSGTASNAIALATGQSKRLTIVAQQEGKTQVAYEIIAVRT